MSFIDILRRRKSTRKFSEDSLTADEVGIIVESALISPTSRNKRLTKFYLAECKNDLEKLADVKENGSGFLKNCALAIAICCNDTDDDCWIEDCSIAATNMQLAAESLNVGSCWCQIRDRHLSDGTSSELIVRGILGIPDDERVLCVIGFGKKKNVDNASIDRELMWERVIIVDS